MPRRTPFLLAVSLLAAACGPTDDDARRAAESAGMRGDWPTAAASWSRVLADRPDARALIGRGEARRRMRDPEGAASDFVEAYSLDPGLVDARFALADVRREQGRWDEALRALSGLERRDADRASRATALVRRDRAAETRRKLLKAVEELRADGREEFAGALARGDWEAAAAFLDRPLRRGDAKALRADLDAAQADAKAARAALADASRGDDAAAVEAACDLAEMDLDAGFAAAAKDRLACAATARLPKETALRARRLAASAAERTGDFAGAVAHLDAATALSPGDLDLAFTRALVLLRAGRPDDAEKDLKRLAADRHRLVQSSLLDGMIRLDRGDAQGAIPPLRIVATAAPDVAMGHLFLGLALAAGDPRSSTARTEMKRAVELDPSFFAGRLALSATELADGSPDDAVESARRCTQIDATRSAGWTALGRALVRRAARAHDAGARDADLESASAALTTAVRLDPRGADAAEAAALLRLAAGRSEETDASKATADAESLARRTTSALTGGDLVEAERAAVSGLELDPDAELFLVAGPLAALRGDAAAARTRIDAAAGRRPDDPKWDAVRALAAGKRGDRAATIDAAKDLVRRAGDDARSVARAALALLAVGASDESRAVLRGATRLSETSRRAAEKHAETAARSREAAATFVDLHLLALTTSVAPAPRAATSVETRAKALSDAASADVVLLATLADLAAARGDARSAAEQYRRVVAAEPRARGRLAALLAATGDEKAAAEEAERAVREGDESRETRLLAADLVLRSGRADAAKELYERTASRDPSCADALAGLGRVAETAGDLPEALRSYERALAVEPAHPAANARLAELLVETAPERAEILARRAVAAAPRFSAARATLGYVLVKRGRAKDAADVLAAASHEFPQNARIALVLGVASARADRPAEAKTALETAQRLDPKSAGPALRLGVLAESSGEFDAARDAYERAVRLDGGDALASNQLAASLLRSDAELDRALQLAQDAARLSKGGAFALDTLGCALLRKDRAHDAALRLADALAASPDDASIRLHLAEALFADGRASEAAVELDRVLAVADFAGRAEAEALRAKMAGGPAPETPPAPATDVADPVFDCESCGK